jgi:hypothetical protein
MYAIKLIGTKIFEEMEVQLHIFITSSRNGSCGLDVTPIYPFQTRIPLSRRLGETLSTSRGGRDKFLPMLGIT